MGDPCMFASAFDKSVLHFLAGLQKRDDLRQALGALRRYGAIRSADPFFEGLKFISQISDRTENRIQKVLGLRFYVLRGD